MPKIETPALCTVKINNNEIKYSINSIELKQFIDNHHELTVALRQDIIGDDRIDDPEPYTAFLGKSISLGIAPTGDKVSASLALEFIGIVTEVRFENSIDEVNILVITAKSPTISMDGAKKNTFSFDQTASDIIGGILRNYPLTLGRIESTSGTLRFSVQYRETDYEYVMRLAAAAGKFAYYDGKEFRVVSASSTDEHELKWRELLGSFSLGLGTTSANFAAQIYNYEQDKLFSQDTTSLSGSTSLSAVSKKSPEASKVIFPDSGYSGDASSVDNARALDAVLTNEKSRSMAKMIKCHGHSIVPNVAVGHCIKISGMDSFNQQFWVTKIIHLFDKTGKYHNEFECTPLDIAYPANSATISRPHTSIQTATVVDNVDPDDLGRIKVKFPWNSSNETVWIRFLSANAGKDRGWFCLPEIDDEVLVAFEEGNPDFPIALGALYNKGNTIPQEAMSNQVDCTRVFKTKSGNLILIIDKDGNEAIEISQKDGKNAIVLSLSGPSLHITSDGGDIIMRANNITIEADSEIKLEAGSNATVKAGGNMKLEASANQNIKGAMVKVEGNPINLN